LSPVRWGVHVHRAHVDVGRVIEHLVLGGDLEQALVGLFLHTVEDAAVSFRADLEIEDELEVRELRHGDDVAPVHVATRRLTDQLASYDFPASGREVFSTVSPPPVRGDTVEQQGPASRPLVCGKHVGCRRVGGRRIARSGSACGHRAKCQQRRESGERLHRTSMLSGSQATTFSSK
jgi:hypothetical protein